MLISLLSDFKITRASTAGRPTQVPWCLMAVWIDVTFDITRYHITRNALLSKTNVVQNVLKWTHLNIVWANMAIVTRIHLTHFLGRKTLALLWKKGLKVYSFVNTWSVKASDHYLTHGGIGLWLVVFLGDKRLIQRGPIITHSVFYNIMRYEINHPFPNFNGAMPVEVWEFICDFIQHFI